MPKGAITRSGRQSAEAAAKTRQQLLDAGLSCFARQGFDATSLRDIAERAGVTHGLPRHHFGSKQGLWEACAARVLTRIEDRQEAALAAIQEGDPMARFREVVRVFLTTAAEHPDFWRLVASEALQGGERLHRLAEMARPQHQRVATLFASVQAEGHMEDTDNDRFFLSLLSLGALPYALAPLSDILLGERILSPKAAAAHTERVIAILFKE